MEGQTVTSSAVLVHTYQNGANNGQTPTHTLMLQLIILPMRLIQ